MAPKSLRKTWLGVKASNCFLTIYIQSKDTERTENYKFFKVSVLRKGREESLSYLQQGIFFLFFVFDQTIASLYYHKIWLLQLSNHLHCYFYLSLNKLQTTTYPASPTKLNTFLGVYDKTHLFASTLFRFVVVVVSWRKREIFSFFPSSGRLWG